MFVLRLSTLAICFLAAPARAEISAESIEEQLFNVEGTAMLAPDMFIPQNWQANSRVLLDYGKYIGFIK